MPHPANSHNRFVNAVATTTTTGISNHIIRREAHTHATHDDDDGNASTTSASRTKPRHSQADMSPAEMDDDTVSMLEKLSIKQLSPTTSNTSTGSQTKSPRQRAISTSTFERQSAARLSINNKAKQSQIALDQSNKSSKHYARKLRNRGLPKKKGGGGAYVWGIPGSEVDLGEYDGGAIDSNDPNYESEEEPFEVIKAKMIKANLRKNCSFEADIKPVLEEYFFNGDAHEFIDCVSQWELGSQRRSDLVQFMAVLAMERYDIHRELVSTLLVPMTLELVTKKQVEKAFMDMLNNLEDTINDIPMAPEYLAKFIVRAACDNCLQPMSLHFFELGISTNEARKCLERIPILLDKGDIDKIWLPLVANRHPVQKSVEELRLIVQHFFEIRLIDETFAQIKKLCIPHFLHELVYLLVENLVEFQRPHLDVAMTCDLLKQLIDMRVMPMGELTQGIKRLKDDFRLIEIYSKNAFITMKQVTEELKRRSLIDDDTSHRLLVELKKRRTKTICLAEQSEDRLKGGATTAGYLANTAEAKSDVEGEKPSNPDQFRRN